MENSTAFRPVRGLEENILSKGYNEGFVYFATDTGNIFLDANGKSKIQMGNHGASLLYANIAVEQASDNDYYVVMLDGIDTADEFSDPVVNVGDLIINRKDGVFYKVADVYPEYAYCEKIAVSGTGGGGGIPGGGGTVTGVTKRGRIQASNLGEIDILNGTDCNISLNITSPIEDDVVLYESYKVNITYTADGSTQPYYTDTLIVTSDMTMPITYEATTFLRKSTETKIVFALDLSEDEKKKFYNNGAIQTPIRISTHELSVDWVASQFTNMSAFDKTGILTSIRFSTGANRILDVFFDDVLVYTKKFMASDSTASVGPLIAPSTFIYNLDGTSSGQTIEPLYTHGRHIISAKLSLAKADNSRGSSTELIKKEIAIYLDEGYPLIWFGDVKETYYEYDNPVIPIRTYDPQAESGIAKIYLFADGADVLEGAYYELNNDTREYKYWTITNLKAGQNTTYQVRVGQDQFATYEQVPEFKVLEDPRQIGVSDRALKVNFDARGRSNAESEKRRKTVMIGESPAKLEGFNWYNNGWIMDENNVTCLRISNGATVTFPIGKMQFAGDVPSHTIEMRMKIRNVQSYEKLITNYTRYVVSSDKNTVISDTTDKNWTDDDPIMYIEDQVNGNYVLIGDNYVPYNAAQHAGLKRYRFVSIFEAFLAQRQTGIASYDAYLTKMLPQLREKNPAIPTYDELGFGSLYRDYNLTTAAIKYIKNMNNPATSSAICLGPQDGYFSNGTNAVTVDYVEDEIINLTIVYDNGNGVDSFGNNRLMKFYLNGMLTSVARSTINGSWAIDTGDLIFDSAGCDIDLYKFRVYDRALGLNEVLRNIAYDDTDVKAWDLAELYTAGKDIDEDYQFSYNKMIQYNKDHPNDTIMPYLLFTVDSNDKTTQGKLPWSKQVPVRAEMEFINPALERAFQTGELAQQAAKMTAEQKKAAKDAGLSEVEYYYLHHCPSFISELTDLSVQGTSSEFYPRRNYKAKTKVKVDALDENGNQQTDEFGDVKQKSVNSMKLHKGPFQEAYEKNPEKAKGQKFFYYDNYVVGTDRFTLKIDYMESSGSYNMGFANLVNTTYSHHPLSDYNNANAFCKGTPGKVEILTAYPASGEVWYITHKGKAKLCQTGNAEKDAALVAKYGNVLGDFAVTNAEDFAKGPVAIGKKKILGGDKTGFPTGDEAKMEENFNNLKEDPVEATWNKIKAYVDKFIAYTPGSFVKTTINNLDSYRTSVQGFPTLAFYQTTKMREDGVEPLFIGRYNMLLDKGSKDAYGFKAKAQQNYVEGKPDVESVAECWEFENNSRGFCSFRDPWNRKELSFKAPVGATNEFTAAKAPIVADSFEYRYSAHDDYLDMFYEMETSFENPTTVKKLQKQYGADITDIASGQQKMLDLYSNWERAVAWVWSTATDAVIDGLGPVPLLGTYEKIELAEYLFGETLENGALAHKFYYETTEEQDVQETHIDEETGEEVTVTVKKNVTVYREISTYGANLGLTEGQPLPDVLTYYLESIVGGKKVYTGVKVTNSEDHLYKKDTYYTLLNKNYILDESESIDPSATYYTLIQDLSALEPWKLDTEVTYGSTTYKYDTQEYRLAKFKNELEDHFNLEYLITYFVLTEVFECYDSRGKNCMMASWGPQTAGGDYIWYPIFYDIDTQLGINNTGIPSFQYNVDATEDGTFSTNDSVLWNNLYALFKNLISEKYQQLCGVPVTNFGKTLPNPPFVDIDTIESWYVCDPAYTHSYSMMGIRPLIALNLDEQYKYISITNKKVGYMYQNGDIMQDASNTYFYALQGSRSMSRRQFLTNRLNYINSWLGVGNYKRGGANRIRSRVSANNSKMTSDKWIEGTATNGDEGLETNVSYYQADGKTKTHMFDGEYWITMTPVRNMYVTVGTDAANFDPIKYSGTPIRFVTADLENGVRKSGNYREQLYYIYGLDQMKSLGDLSKLYFQEFELSGKIGKMTDLKLGYDGLDEGGNSYKNSGVNDWTIPAAAGTLDGGMPLLREVNLCNITFKNNNTTFDFSSCEKLKNFRNTGSNITQVKFADGVALDTLYLTNTTTALRLVEANLLTDLITEYKAPELDDNGELIATPGLYIQNLTDGKNETNITTFDIQGGKLGYNSYRLLSMYRDACVGDTTPRRIQLTKVQWSPYEIITDVDQVYDKNAKYFVDDGHFGLKPYPNPEEDEVYTASAWKAHIANNRIYEYNATTGKEVATIKDLSLFRELITDEIFKSTANSNNEIPNITGYVYIDNDSNIDEGMIQTDYANKFPGLKFFFKNVTKGYAARFVVMDGDVEVLIGTDKIGINQTATKRFFKNPMPRTAEELKNAGAFSPSQINLMRASQDFIGWSTTKDRSGLVESYDAIFVTALGNTAVHNWDTLELTEEKDYTFYAVFEDHNWEVNFYIVDDDEKTMRLAHSYQVVDGRMLHDPKLLLSRDESNLPDDKRYRFLGFTQKATGNNVTNNPNTLVADLDSLKAVRNYNFYALFYEESVKSSPTDISFFNFTKTAYLDVFDSKYNIEEGYAVTPAKGAKLAGKITIPATYDNLPVITVGGFSGQTGITHIYWYGEPQIREFYSDAFNGCSELRYFEFPKTVREIGANCFRSCSHMKPFDLSISPVARIQNFAFLDTFETDRLELLHFPGTLIHIGQYGFKNNNIMNGVGCLQIGGPGDPTQLRTIGQNGNPYCIGNDPSIESFLVYSTDGMIPPVVQAALDDGRIEIEGARDSAQA